jgi:hypothetical protein
MTIVLACLDDYLLVTTLNEIVFLFIIIGNFFLKVVDDLFDNDNFRVYRPLGVLFLVPLFFMAVFILLDKEGLIITGSYLLSAPLRGKADQKETKLAMVALYSIIGFLLIYTMFFQNGQGWIFGNKIISAISYLLVFIYFFIAVFVNNSIFEHLVTKIPSYHDPFFYSFVETSLAIVPFHLLIVVPLYLGGISLIAFLASLLSFFAYGVAGYFMKGIENKYLEVLEIKRQLNFDTCV